MTGGRITALLQPRVLGHAFNPLTLYWCHDRHGVLRHVVAEVHNTHGERHTSPSPDGGHPALATKRLYASRFTRSTAITWFAHPGPDRRLDVDVSLYRGDEPAFVATVRGKRRPATITEVLRLQLVAPAAPLLGRLAMRVQGVMLWLRGVPRVPWRPMPEPAVTTAAPPVRIAVTDLRDSSVAS